MHDSASRADQPGFTPACPAPGAADEGRISLGHGEGGWLSRQLIRQRIVPVMDSDELRRLGDAACLPGTTGPLALTTDSFVVSPLIFPGGDIGSLAVFGTVNDLAVSGSRPRWITLSLILEEGLPIATLDRILHSVARAARRAEVAVVTGDTKVVPRGAADGLYLNTAGIGELLEPAIPGPESLQQGDVLLVSGPIARHGVAILAARESLGFEPPPQSDSAPLTAAMDALRRSGVVLRAARDATRGGVAAVFHEWAEPSGKSLCVDESCIPLTDEVRGVCELLGLDPLHVACEGTMVVAVPAEQADRAVQALRGVPETAQAAVIGEVLPRDLAPVLVRRGLGREVPLDEPLGAPLPRIC